MSKEDDIKLKIFNTIQMNQNTKKKYFRIEKNRISDIKQNKNKAIFKTEKENILLNKKTMRDFKSQKPIKNNKFITTTIDETTASVQSENSFLVQNVIPKKICLIKENKKELSYSHNFSKLKNFGSFPYAQRGFFMKNVLVGNIRNENDENNSENIKNFDNYNIKLMFVYFYSIQNLCKYINNNFFNIQISDSKIIMDEFIHQVYQDLQILNRKINKFKIFQKFKEKLKLNQSDFKDIYALKENLQLMKNALKNRMSQNLITIYLNIDNFCMLYSSSSK